MADADTPILPAHIEDTVQSIARLHTEHHENATPLQRAVERLTAFLGQPRFIGMMTAVVACWVGGNLAALALGWTPIDPPPFGALSTTVSLAAFYVTLLILTTQRREDQLGQLREQLTLELAIVSEQKMAKVITLLQDMRRDDPSLPSRHDTEAEAMGTPADPQSVLDAIKDSHGAAPSGRPAVQPPPG